MGMESSRTAIFAAVSVRQVQSIRRLTSSETKPRIRPTSKTSSSERKAKDRFKAYSAVGSGRSEMTRSLMPWVVKGSES